MIETCSNKFCMFLRIFMLIFFSLALAASGKETKSSVPPTLNDVQNKLIAKGALLVDASTGKILFEKNADTTFIPASTVKLMTALLVYEQTKLKGNMIISRGDVRVEPSHIPLRIGEKVSVFDLVHTLLIGSDNDSAMALARKVGGSVPRFVDIMNLRAQQLGCKSTKFINPHGLPDKNRQCTTPRDLYLIFQKVISIPELRRIMQIKNYTLRTRVGVQNVRNHNKLLGKYSGMGPAKTGWTYASRHTYAASATRHGKELHLILLNSSNKWDDARLLFDYGFSALAVPFDAQDVQLVDASSNPQDHLDDEEEDMKNVANTTEEKRSEPEAKNDVAIAKFTPKPQNNTISYKIRKGDSFAVIARRNGCKTEDIQSLNPKVNSRSLRPGQIIFLPAKQ